MTGPERAYPLPAVDEDPRFTLGLLADMVRVLEAHGYPPVRDGLDLVELQQALYGFLYGTGGAR